MLQDESTMLADNTHIVDTEHGLRKRRDYLKSKTKSRK